MRLLINRKDKEIFSIWELRINLNLVYFVIEFMKMIICMRLSTINYSISNLDVLDKKEQKD